MSALEEPNQPSSAFARLGTGDREDRLRLRLVLHILFRTLPVLKEVRGPIVLMVAGFLLLLLPIFPLGAWFLGSLWDGVLLGNALSTNQAWILGLDPALYVGVDRLDAAARAAVRDRWIIAVLITTAVMAPLSIALLYFAIWILQRINQVLRVQLVERLQALSLRFHADSRVGDAIYRVYQDSAMVTAVINTVFMEPARFGLVFALGLGAVAVFHVGLALLLAAVWIPSIALGFYFSGRLRVQFRQAREANSELTSLIQEIVSGIRVIKAYGAEQIEQERFEAASLDAFDTAFSARSNLALFGVSMFWAVGPALLAGHAWAAMLTVNQTELYSQGLAAILGFSVWTLGGFNFFKGRNGSATQSVEFIFRNWGRAQDITIGLDRVFEVLDLEPEVVDRSDAIPLAGLEKQIRFQDVHFRYQPDRPVLEGINLEIQPGTVNAIVGPTGCGKSTLVSLLLRLYEPDEGKISIDGVDLDHFQLDSLRSNVSIALQENVLFDATVRENIRYAAPSASDAQVRAAARVACADSFIENLPGGYDTPLGERGSKLSTGQRQRLSIARAILKDTPILILDEPTASLDAETELEVLRRLSEWGQHRIVLLITHRLSTIRHADHIISMEDGRIVETGSHDELMSRPGSNYRKLVEYETVAPVAASGDA
jgi:ABC-type multidrug transport system fused ATPase/permease subunit